VALEGVTTAVRLTARPNIEGFGEETKETMVSGAMAVGSVAVTDADPRGTAAKHRTAAKLTGSRLFSRRPMRTESRVITPWKLSRKSAKPLVLVTRSRYHSSARA
jgi:hypothetical protein